MESSPSSCHTPSSSDNSSPAPPQTASVKCTSALIPAGSLLQLNRYDIKTSTKSNGFSLMNHQVFGNNKSSSHLSQFGGLGSLGLTATLARTHFGTIPEWWLSSESHKNGAPTFLSPFLGLNPVIAPTFKNKDPVHLKSYTSGLNGTVNNRNGSTLIGNISNSSLSAGGSKKKTQISYSPKSQDSCQSPRKTAQKTKVKKPRKKPAETMNMNGSLSGSLSDSSSEDSSSDADDVDEKEDEDSEDEEDDRSSDSEEAELAEIKEKVKHLTQNMCEDKRKRSCSEDVSPSQDNHHNRGSLYSLNHPQSSSHRRAQPQSAMPSFQSHKTRHEKNQQHVSVIQAPAVPATVSQFAHSTKEVSPLAFRCSPSKKYSTSSTKQLPPSASLKHSSHVLSYKHSSVSSSPKPLNLCSSDKPLYPNRFCLTSSQKPFCFITAHKPPSKSVSQKLTLEKGSSHPKSSKRLKDRSPEMTQTFHFKDSLKKDFILQHNSENNLFLTLPDDQDVPLALISKPQSQSTIMDSIPPLTASSPSCSMPINLSTSNEELHRSSALSPHTSASLLITQKSIKVKRSTSSADLVQGGESDVQSNKDSESDSSVADADEDQGEEEEDSGSSLSESGSNLESDFEDEMKKQVRTEAETDAEKIPLDVSKAPLCIRSSSFSSSISFMPSLSVIKAPNLPDCFRTLTLPTHSSSLSNSSSTASSLKPKGLTGKRKRVTDERLLRLPLKFGWKRETHIRMVAGRLQGDVIYLAPCGKKLRQYPDVMKYLYRNGIKEISRDNFSFSTKIKVGDFYDSREEVESLQQNLLAAKETAGGQSRCFKSLLQSTVDASGRKRWKTPPINITNTQDFSEATLLRKLEAEEIVHQATQMKLMRKHERQAMALAAKEAKRQQAIKAAEEKRIKREQMKILKQQEKIKRIQQIRLEKEFRAQQILEAKRRKKEAAANARILEAEKRNKEKEMQQLHAVILKHQELKRLRLDMEKERRRQHMMLMKAVESRKKAEEKERLRKEKKDEKRFHKERKQELKRLELEKAKELRKPNEDMCLSDHKCLPELSRVHGLVLSGSTFSDCLMVLQFLHNFGKVLGLEENLNNLKLSDIQDGLLNIKDYKNKVQDLLVRMLSIAVSSPGIPAGHKNKTILGEHLTNVDINRDNVSEILQIFMEAHCGRTQLSALALSLRTKAFQAHSPSQKASILAFLVNELCCSKAVISEIEKSIDHMNILRKDKWAVEGKIRKLRSIHTKRMAERDSSVGEENGNNGVTLNAKSKSKLKEADNEEEEDEDDDSEDQGENEDEEDEGSGRKKVKMCEVEDDSEHPVDIEELEKQIEKTCKQQRQIRQKLFELSCSFHSMMLGQDRYKRCYWLLPQCGGIFVEAVESSGGNDELEKDTDHVVRVKEEQPYETKTAAESRPAPGTEWYEATAECHQDKDRLNLFLQKPGSLSKLSKLLEVAKLAGGSNINFHNRSPVMSPTAASYLCCPSSQTGTSHSPLPASAQHGYSVEIDASVPLTLFATKLKSSPQVTFGPPSVPQADRFNKILTEKRCQWFSLLPRSPCDESLVTRGFTSSPQTTNTKTIPSSSIFLNTPSRASHKSPSTNNNGESPVLQQVESGRHENSLTLLSMSSVAVSTTLPPSGTCLPTMVELASQHAKGNGHSVDPQVNNNTINKSENPEASSDMTPVVSPPTVEAAKTQDYTRCQSIPEEMLHGWWRVSDINQVHCLVEALHSRGIREKVLHRQIQKHMEFVTQIYDSSRKDGAVINIAELEKQDVSEKILKTWSVEEKAMEVDVTLLQQIEALERKVVSADVQVKGWMPSEPESDRKDLVYHEHRLISSSASQKESRRSNPVDIPGSIVRRPNNPLDIAVTRLAELENNIKKRKEEPAPGMRLWHKALGQVRSSSQLSLCVQQLQKSVTWDQSVMKVHCHLCQKADNEELLLLCDSCERGCHTYCLKPSISPVPEGDWLCSTCVSKESVQSPWNRRQKNKTAAGEKKRSEVKQNDKPSVFAELIKEEASSSNCVWRKSSKDFGKRKGARCQHSPEDGADSSASLAKKAKMCEDNADELSMCSLLLADLEAHPDSWPFLTPVNHKAVPGYKKVIKKPMDFSTIRERLQNNQYSSLETFFVDVNLVFDNCQKFNEDDSEIGRAGHNMRRFFEKRWTELLM